MIIRYLWLSTYLLGVISCWFLYKVKSRWSWLVGAILITFSLTLYQAYLSVTILSAIFIVIGACIRGDEIENIMGQGIKIVACRHIWSNGISSSAKIT